MEQMVTKRVHQRKRNRKREGKGTSEICRGRRRGDGERVGEEGM
jgi:hypothetical protein